ncbi:eCIS core domain-containing protein [Archangium lansingense]|uniref:DUF4157 domain-containing protein n=1 Tax=Archangium lansingense TaxID=2995310 RepID=A0ABT4AAI8_9BACT|nr:DUF4157 domain-containing protein [Archangium lansinium]MCY1078692.1 DUF4157 domain-containing protein [Archangium lansinium]
MSTSQHVARQASGQAPAASLSSSATMVSTSTPTPAETRAPTRGEPLPDETRHFFEPRFGHSFADVRVFADDTAAAAARAAEANAFTLGRSIVFGAGQWAPGTDTGRQLLAHELAHVVQQQARPPSEWRLQRQACGHDKAEGSGCAGLREVATDKLIALDRYIVELGLKRHFPGSWISQVYSPPNPVKKGKKFGKVDALKIKEGSALEAEVLEIKSRNTTGYGISGESTGGCKVATDETTGYVTALQALAPQMVTVSSQLAPGGGYMIADDAGQQRCRTAPALKVLAAAGVDVKDPDTVTAWCVYNSIQNRLGHAFTQGFSSVSFTASTESSPGTDYPAFYWASGTCGRGRKKRPARKGLLFQVNGAGGLSYRCERSCPPEDEEEEKRKEKEKAAETTVEARDEKQPRLEEISPDYDPYEEGDPIPSEGIDRTQVVITTLLGTSAVYAAHLAYKKAKIAAEKKALEAVRDRALAEMKRRGAGEASKMLNSQNASKFGKKAYEQVIDKADDVGRRVGKGIEKKVERRLTRMLGEKAAKTALSKGARAIPYIGLVLTATEVFGIMENVAHGAELGVGLSGDEVDLSGSTQLGDQPESGEKPTVEGILRDTRIEVDVDRIPGAKGVIELQTDNVKLSGKPASDGDVVTVDLKLKMKNTTITIRQDGVVRGNDVVISGDVEIIDSQIEIDLPEGTMLEPAEGGGKKRIIKGVKVKITSVGKSAGEGGTLDIPEGQAPADKDKTATPEPVSEERKKLLTEVNAEPRMKKLAEAVFAKKGVRVPDEALQRLIALKEALSRHPELVDAFISSLEKAENFDILRDLIAPMEEALKKADEQKPEEEKKKLPEGTATTTPPTTAPPSTRPPTVTTPGPTRPPATAVKFTDVMPKMTFPRRTTVEKSPPQTLTGTIELTLDTSSGQRVYRFTVSGTFVKALKPHEGEAWRAEYDCTIPSGVITSEQGDEPIQFSDGRTNQRFEFDVDK